MCVSKNTWNCQQFYSVLTISKWEYRSERIIVDLMKNFSKQRWKISSASFHGMKMHWWLIPTIKILKSLVLSSLLRQKVKMQKRNHDRGNRMTIITWRWHDAYNNNNISGTSLIGRCVAIRRDWRSMMDFRLDIGSPTTSHPHTTSDEASGLSITFLGNIQCDRRI